MITSLLLFSSACCWPRSNGPAPVEVGPPAPAAGLPSKAAPPPQPTQYKYCRPWGLPHTEPPTDVPDPNQEWTLGTIENGDLGCYVSMCAKDGKLYTFQGDDGVCVASADIEDWFGYQVQAQFERLEAQRVCVTENECTNVPARIGVARLRRVGDTGWQPKK
jgi:hypothetical protein